MIRYFHEQPLCVQDAGEALSVPSFFRTSFDEFREYYKNVWLPAIQFDTHSEVVRADPFVQYRSEQELRTRSEKGLLVPAKEILL